MKMPKTIQRTALTAAIALGSLVSLSATAQQPDPYMLDDDTWISISGTVENVTRDAFSLDYGDGIVTVEMDDGDRDADAYALLEGDKVTVNGLIDDDFFETTSIEASSVYVEKLGTYFYASALDEEDYTVWYTVPLELGQVTLQGTVTEVDDDEFMLNQGNRSIEVDIDTMAYNPLDDQGYQKIDVGDRVRVTGVMDNELFDGAELDARTIVSLSDNS